MENTYHFDTIAKAIHYIKLNHLDQPSLEEVAEHVHLSKYHLQRLFQQWVGLSPKAFLQYITVEQAKRSLTAGISTLEAAYESGLSGNGRLHDLFVKIEACTPGEFKQRGRGLRIIYQVVETPFGNALLAETERGICKIHFLSSDEEALDLLQADYPDALLETGIGPNGKLLLQYFTDWQIPQTRIGIDLRGTPFQIQVWKALLQIPPAQLSAYQQIANWIEKPKAVRAVGTAIGKNPIAYLIPCHRVIKSDGQMGNYRWAAERKVAINGYELARIEKG